MSRDARIQVLMDKEAQLDAIADAPKCEHGNVYRHIVAMWDGSLYVIDVDEVWCDGAPEKRAAIDALTEENKT